MLQPGLKSAISLESLFSYHFINALVMKLGPIQSALTKGSKIQHTNFLDKMTHCAMADQKEYLFVSLGKEFRRKTFPGNGESDGFWTWQHSQYFQTGLR